MMNKRIPIWTDAQAPLRAWYASGLGQSILEQLGEQLDHITPGIFGYQGLQVGSLHPDLQMLGKAGLHRSILLDSPSPSIASSPSAESESDTAAAEAGNEGKTEIEIRKATDAGSGSSSGSGSASHRLPDIGADVLSLPIASDVMKVVVMPHTLDFCHLPHQALREADRVLTNDGHLIIVGFNPLSQFGAGHLTLRWRQQVPWNGQFYSRKRVTDWLSVLNYRVMHSSAFYLRPPLQSPRLLARLQSIEKAQRYIGAMGGLYLLHARKQTLPLSMSRRHWLRQRSGIAVGSFARIRDPQSSVQPSSATHRQWEDDNSNN